MTNPVEHRSDVTLHPVVAAIYATHTVTDGRESYSALSRHGQPTYMDAAEGALIQRLVAKLRPRTTLEVGMAYGVSTLFFCDALSRLDHPGAHIAIDPFQRTKWHGVGLHNVCAAGFDGLVRFIEERSELCLPRLVEEGAEIQLALIDGLHVFEQCVLEFYYIDRMLPVGGVVIFDDVGWPPVRRAVRLALSFGTYKVTDHSGSRENRRTLLGRVRRSAARLPLAQAIFRHDLLVRDWDLGIAGSCVALEKISAHRRTHGDYAEF